jgi:hypothetical protein
VIKPALEWIELAPGAVYSALLTNRELKAQPKFQKPGKYQVFAISPLRMQKQGLANRLKSYATPEEQDLIPYSAWALDKSNLGKAAFDANILGEPVTYTVVDPKTYQPKPDN